MFKPEKLVLYLFSIYYTKCKEETRCGSSSLMAKQQLNIFVNLKNWPEKRMDSQTEKIRFSHLPRQVTSLVIKGDMPLLKAWRIYLGMPLAETAEKSGLDAYIIADMERKDNLLSSDLRKIAQAMGVEVDLLVDIDPIKDLPDIYC